MPMATELVRTAPSGVELSEALRELQARYDQANRQWRARQWIVLHRVVADCARLQSALDAKNEFLDIVSHELRTPLAIIGGDAVILLRSATAIDEHMRQALTDIKTESDRMATILDNLLVLARPELNNAASAEPCIVIRIVERAIANHGQLFPQRQLRVEYSDKSNVIVDCVETYLHQVLQNLLSNAEKYSPEGEPIIVRIQPADAEVRICVLDSGKGFTPEEASRVFETFFRIKDERSLRPGLGVGLSVCKRLVEVMGGSIWATSRPEGGAEVGFSLPLDPSSVD